MTYPAVIFWVLLLWGLVSRGPALLYLLIGACGIETLAVLPPALVGGVTLQPSSVAALAMFGKLLLNRAAARWLLTAAIRFRMLALLFLFFVLAVITTVFCPRLFAGMPVIPLRSAGVPIFAGALNPSAANVTQLAYFGISIATVFSVAYQMCRPEFQRWLPGGFLAGGVFVIISGLADMFAQRFGLGSLLEPFRNASYSLLTDDVVMGTKRVVGLMSEASVYGPACVSFAAILTLLRPYFLTAGQRRVCVVTILGLLAMTWLSTSTTAFLGLGMFGLVYAADWCRRLLSPGRAGKTTVMLELVVAVSAAGLLMLFVALDGAVFNSAVSLFDYVVLDKAGSSSYAIRTTWNQVSWQALVDTRGLGVGVGSTRSSNWLIAVASNTGLQGSAVLGLFLLQTILRPAGRDRYVQGLAWSLKLALLVPVATTIASSSTPDFGIFTAIILGAITGLSLARKPAALPAAVEPVNAEPAKPAAAALPA